MPGRACLCIPLNKLKVFTRRRIRRESLEKEKALAARRRQFIFYFGNVRQRSSLEGREGIVLEQRARLLFAKPVDNHVVSRLQTKRPRARVVRIAGHEMDEALADPPQRLLPGTGAEASGQRASGHLREAAQAYPLFQALRTRAQNGVALRVRDHGLHAGKLNLVQCLIHRRRDRKLIELHKQEIALIDAILPGILAQRYEILRIEMKIAAGGDLQPVADLGLQLISKLAHLRKIEKVFVAGMRRRDDVRDPIGNRRLCHGYRHFHGGRTIIETRQNVTVQINHVNYRPLVPPSIQRLPRAEGEQYPCKNLAHQPRIDPFRQDPPRDTAQKHARDQQQPGFPRDESFFRIHQQRQRSGGWYQRHQGSSLRAMLFECEEQPQEWHQQYTPANAKHSRGDSTNAGDREDARAACDPLSHGRSPRLCRQHGPQAGPFSRAGTPPASGNIQMLLSNAVMAWEARSSSLHKHREAFQARTKSPHASPPALAPSTRAVRRVRLAATK